MPVLNIAVGRCAVPVLVPQLVLYPVSVNVGFLQIGHQNSIHPHSPRLELAIHLRASSSPAVSVSGSNCVCKTPPSLGPIWKRCLSLPDHDRLLLMDASTFTFTFQFPSTLLTPGNPTPTLTAHPTANSQSSPITTTASGQASPPTTRASYRIRNTETEKSLRKMKDTKKISSDNLQALSSAELRASKTFAAFRDYVRQFMFWVAVDDDDPAEVAAYERFLRRNAPNLSREMSDDDFEFLFRHVTPEPESIDV
ncbi:hypothetical protein DFH06DRAFT_1150812 [Mycena polygramma]|nr:hypothetical protein DFH06DRAFT_1150812 [Mycena polygramma]